LFNAETKNGEDMGHFNEILQKAVTEIIHVFQKAQQPETYFGSQRSLNTRIETNTGNRQL